MLEGVIKDMLTPLEVLDASISLQVCDTVNTHLLHEVN